MRNNTTTMALTPTPTLTPRKIGFLRHKTRPHRRLEENSTEVGRLGRWLVGWARLQDMRRRTPPPVRLNRRKPSVVANPAIFSPKVIFSHRFFSCVAVTLLLGVCIVQLQLKACQALEQLFQALLQTRPKSYFTQLWKSKGYKTEILRQKAFCEICCPFYTLLTMENDET